jgi:hypothetical protein
MVQERASVFEVTQLGLETTLGTAVVATKKLLGVSITNKIMTETNTFRPKGSRWSTLAIQNKEWTEADWTAEVATYTDPMYAFAAMFGAPNTTTPGGATLTRNHQWSPPTFTGITPKPLTFESGSYVRAGKAAGNIVKSINWDFNRDGVSWGASSFGQKYTDGFTLTPGTNEVQTITTTGTPTGGTFKLTFYGEQTGTIVWNASAAVIVAALEALPNIGTGNVTATGGPLPTGVAVTFKGPWASQDVPLMTADYTLLTGGTTPTVAIAATTPGAALSEIPLKPVSGNHWNLYLDSSAASLGTTKMTRALSCGWSIDELYNPLWVGNTANTSWVNYVDGEEPTAEFTMMLEADAAGMAYLTQLAAGTSIFARIEAVGELIEGALFYRHWHDIAFKLKDIDPFDSDQGVTTVSWTGEIVHDTTWGKALDINMRNIQTGL